MAKVNLREDEFCDLNINDQLSVRISRGDVGYVVDVFDKQGELFETMCIWDDDLNGGE